MRVSGQLPETLCVQDGARAKVLDCSLVLDIQFGLRFFGETMAR